MDSTPILLSDPRVAAIDVRDCGEPLVRLNASFGPARALVRAGLADRLTDAARRLPIGLTFRVIEGHRSLADQKMIIAAYSARLLDDHPDLSGAELARLSSPGDSHDSAGQVSIRHETQRLTIGFRCLIPGRGDTVHWCDGPAPARPCRCQPAQGGSWRAR